MARAETGSISVWRNQALLKVQDLLPLAQLYQFPLLPLHALFSHTAKVTHQDESNNNMARAETGSISVWRNQALLKVQDKS
jgi:hypothetical protein